MSFCIASQSQSQSDEQPKGKLANLEKVMQARYEKIKESTERLPIILKSFEDVTRENVETNVLEYWRARRTTHRELSQLASIVLAVPSTEVSVERLFSNVRFILNPLRASLKSTSLDDIILIRANKKKIGMNEENKTSNTL